MMHPPSSTIDVQSILLHDPIGDLIARRRKRRRLGLVDNPTHAKPAKRRKRSRLNDVMPEHYKLYL